MFGKTVAHQYLEATPQQHVCNLDVRVENQDCLELARTIQKQHGSVCVLNMANQFHVGGDYLTSCTLAQEESLIKRTNLLDTLIQLDGVKHTVNPCNPYQYALADCLGFDDTYQHSGFGEFTCLYSPHITVHNLDNEQKAVFKINIISSAAYNLSNLTEELNQERYLAGTVLKIINQLRTAKAHEQRHLVLGAFGCGAFGNNPDFIASIYHAAIEELEFIGCFDAIYFAITQNHSNGNYDTFHRIFDKKIPAKPLHNLLMPAFEEQTQNALLKKMLAPFFKIETHEKLIYLASKLIKTEIHALNVQPNNPKEQFLRQLLEQITQTPESGQSILDAVLSAPETQTHYRTSKFFSAEPTFLRELKRLLLWHSTTELAGELFPDSTHNQPSDSLHSSSGYNA